MKCLSLWQPWASLVIEGVKTIETRSWAPPVWMHGKRIAIHAAKNAPKTLDIGFGAKLREALGDGYSFPAGAVLGTVQLANAVQVEEIRRDTNGDLLAAGCYDAPHWSVNIDPWGDFSVGRWLWILTDVQKFDTPVPARGRQRLWNWEAA